MLKPALPVVPRSTPPRTYIKYLKYAWKPPPTEEQNAWGRAAASYLRHHANLRPDAFTPLSDLNMSRSIINADPGQVFEWVKNDRHRRFQVVSEFDRVEGRQGWRKTWYIRAREGHTIPGVDISTTRVTTPGPIHALVYTTTPEYWNLIEQHGLRPEFPTPHVPNPPNRNFLYFANHLTSLSPSTFSLYPAPPKSPHDTLVQLHIKLDVVAAMNAGIKFFATKTKQIISTGLADRSIPPEFFKNIFVVTLKREMLYHHSVTPRELPA